MPSVRSGIAPTSRTQIAATARGLIAESGFITTGSATPTVNAASGNLTMGLVGLRAGDVITNVIVRVTTVGVSVSFAKLGLFDSSGNFLAATASVSANFNVGTGFKVTALTAPYTIGADGGYYAGFLQYGAGATGAALDRAIALVGVGTVIGSFAGQYAQVANQTDITGNVTPATATTGFWFGVS